MSTPARRSRIPGVMALFALAACSACLLNARGTLPVCGVEDMRLTGCWEARHELGPGLMVIVPEGDGAVRGTGSGMFQRWAWARTDSVWSFHGTVICPDDRPESATLYLTLWHGPGGEQSINMTRAPRDGEDSATITHASWDAPSEFPGEIAVYRCP